MTRRVRAFKRWMEARGIDTSDALQISDDPQQGLSVRALSRLSAGDLVATIPKAACLTAKTSAASGIIEEAGLGGTVALALAVMYERSLGGASPWAGYLQLLGEGECVPLLWSLGEVDELLKGTELHKTVKEDQTLVFEDWRDLIKPLIKVGPMIDQNDFSMTKYFSAKTLVSSRSFVIDDFHGIGMVPFADLFNHKTDGENVHFTTVYSSSLSDEERDQDNENEDVDDASSVIDPSGCSSGDNSDVLEMVVVRDVDTGAEVFNTYGCSGNAALLHRYGFTELDNLYDIVNIDLNLVENWCSASFSNRFFRTRVSLWRRLGYSACMSQDMEYFEISYEGVPQPDFLVLLYIIFLEEDPYEKLRYMDTSLMEADEVGKVANVIEISGYDCPVGPGNIEELLLTENVCRALLSLADIRESLYGWKTLEDDMSRLRACCPIIERKLYHSLVLRASERKIIAKLRTYALKWSRSRKRKARCKI